MITCAICGLVRRRSGRVKQLEQATPYTDYTERAAAIGKDIPNPIPAGSWVCTIHMDDARRTAWLGGRR